VGLVLEMTTDLKLPGWHFLERHAHLCTLLPKMSPRAKLIKLADRLHNLARAWGLAGVETAALREGDA